MSVSFSILGRLGNLGNQLFQIASVTGIAETIGTDAVFPSWKYDRYFKNHLPHGNITRVTRIPETQYHHDQQLIRKMNPGTNYDLHGYFQSEKYWNKETILKQFEFEETFKQTLSQIYDLSRPHVAISIRRGDFVNNPNYFQLSIAYYLNAYYKHFGKEYYIIIFSDDFDYCKAHFSAIPRVYFASGLNDIEQLCLGSMCENFIISNSTFSWWMAYLSQSKNVYRPEKNMDGKLAAMNSERDYWIPEWKVFKDYKIDLSDTTFIIPVFFDHKDRMQNLMLTLAFLNSNFETDIILCEQGGSEFEGLEDYVTTYLQFHEEVFHRTKMINQMVRRAETPIVVNWDCDNICAPVQIVEAVQAIRNGADISYPFDGTVYRVPRYLFATVAENLDVHSLNQKYCAEKHSSVGHAVVMNKESFIKAGMENENFISWSHEDSERFNRYNILGLDVKRIPGAMYHMDHFCGVNSSSKNPYYHQGEREFLKIATRTREQLKNYIESWTWLKTETNAG